MLNPRRVFQRKEIRVMSLEVQAREVRADREQAVFELLVRHLLDRLLNNEAFGEDAATRVVQLAYAVALPGLLIALFLFPAYHHPPPNAADRGYWAQAGDHFFYVVYSFVVMGAATVFQADLLFPDLLDVYVLGVLPLQKRKLLLARMLALAIFLAIVLTETGILGAIFLPAVADLHRMFWRHFAAHSVAIAMSGIFACGLFIAVQGTLVCMLGQRLFRRIAPLVQAISIALLLTVLFLFPLLSHFLRLLLTSAHTSAEFFPPFWFLGVYERLLWGKASPTLFVHLAATGLWAAMAAMAAAVLTYPLAYARQTRQVIEGVDLRSGRNWAVRQMDRLLHLVLVRKPQARAIHHLIGQTVLRTQRLRLYLAMYAGAGMALIVSELIRFRLGGGHIHLVISAGGIRMAVPIAAFWSITGFRTALQSPIGARGSWIFPLIHGRPLTEQLRAVRVWTFTFSLLLTILLTAVLRVGAPVEMQSAKTLLGQLLVAFGLCLLLTDLFFLRNRSIPFTEARVPSVNDLPIILVRYFVLFPAFVLTVVSCEAWIEASAVHLVLTLLFGGAAHYALQMIRRKIALSQGSGPIEDESLLRPLVLFD